MVLLLSKPNLFLSKLVLFLKELILFQEYAGIFLRNLITNTLEKKSKDGKKDREERDESISLYLYPVMPYGDYDIIGEGDFSNDM